MNKSIQILRKDTAFIKFFELIKDKYRSLGHMGGKISVDQFSDNELEAISGLLGISIDREQLKKGVPLSRIEKSFEKSIFKEYSLFQLVEEVLEETILTKVEEQSIKQNKEQEFLSYLVRTMPEVTWWWNRIGEKTADSRFIWNLYNENIESLIENLKTVYDAYASLPQNSLERIPLFAQRITSNPHSFDQNKILGKLLVHCLFSNQLVNRPDFIYPKSIEDLNELYENYNLMRDDLWSFVTCRGLLAETENGEHPVWTSAAYMGTVLNVPMKELLNIRQMSPSAGKKVWVVENSGVCSTIIDQIPDAPIICTHGQFRMASWKVIDLLVQSNNIIYYSGDFDPEGIVMAERLKNRYPNNVEFWRMDKTSYEIAVSNEDISSRLKKLDVVESLELQELIVEIKSLEKAGYQEGIIDLLINDIRKEYRGLKGTTMMCPPKSISGKKD